MLTTGAGKVAGLPRQGAMLPGPYLSQQGPFLRLADEQEVPAHSKPAPSIPSATVPPTAPGWTRATIPMVTTAATQVATAMQNAVVAHRSSCARARVLSAGDSSRLA